MTSYLPLKNETVLVTGATGGIGRAIVLRVAELGGHPILHYRSNEGDAQALLDRIDGHGTLVKADLAEEHGAGDLWEAAENSVGRIGSLVNNAGIRAIARIEDDFDEWSQAWEADLRVNLRAPADLCRMAIKHFRGHGGGHVRESV